MTEEKDYKTQPYQYKLSDKTYHETIKHFDEDNDLFGGPGSSVGIATGYRLDSPGTEFSEGEIFRACQDRPWGPSSLL
jgi:hypothetical protein